MPRSLEPAQYRASLHQKKKPWNCVEQKRWTKPSNGVQQMRWVKCRHNCRADSKTVATHCLYKFLFFFFTESLNSIGTLASSVLSVSSPLSPEAGKWGLQWFHSLFRRMKGEEKRINNFWFKDITSLQLDFVQDLCLQWITVQLSCTIHFLEA